MSEFLFLFSFQFCEIFKSTFFIEQPRWLLLPILKPLDSQRQLCKRISKLVTIYFISTFLVLVGIFVFILANTSFPFTSRRLCGWKNMTFLVFMWPHNWSVTWLYGWVPFILIQHLTKFWRPGTRHRGDITFLTWHVTTWLMCHVTL